MNDEWEIEAAQKAIRKRQLKNRAIVSAARVPYLSDDTMDILHVVASEYDIPLHWLFSTSRAAKFARPRQWAMYRLYRDTEMSTKAIGRIFSRDHTTVIHAIKTVEGDEDYLERYAAKMVRAVCKQRTNMVQLSVG